ANKYHHSLRIVTMEGDSLNRGGSMTGGAFKSKGNLLGRNREVRELEKKLKKISEELAQAEEIKRKYDSEIEKVKVLQRETEQMFREVSEKQHAGEMELSAAAARNQDCDRQRHGLDDQIAR